MYKAIEKHLQGQFIIPGGNWEDGVPERKNYSSYTLKNSGRSPCKAKVKTAQARKREDSVNIHSCFWKSSLSVVT